MGRKSRFPFFQMKGGRALQAQKKVSRRPESSSKKGALISKKRADISTHVAETVLKFVIGKKSLDNFDSCADNIRQIGVDEMISTYPQMYDRYLNKMAQ